MPKKKSEFISSMGTGFQVLKALSNSLHHYDGDDSHLRRLLTDGDLRYDVVQMMLRADLCPPPHCSVDVYHVDMVTGSLETLLGNGNYSNVHEDSLKFPTEVMRDGRIHLVRFDRDVKTTEEVVREIDQLGLRPANISELLAMGAQFPMLQIGFPIVSLGTTFNSGWRELVPCLDYIDEELGRRFWNVSYEVHWGRAWRFASIPK